MFWVGGKLTVATLKGKFEEKYAIRYGGSVAHIALTPGRTVRIDAGEFA
jgi:hypothetical protein